MDTKEIKNHLKEAREAIRKKEYDAAIKHAETILTSDKDNYNALVFLGAAAQELNEFEKAEKSFRTAVTIQPNQLLAWQGWCVLCEKIRSPSHQSELLIIYEKLISLQTDSEKKFDLMRKLAQLYSERKEFDKTLGILKSQYEIVDDDANKKFQIDQAVVKILSSDLVIYKENENLMKSSLINIFSTDNELDIEDRKLYTTEYIKLLLKDNNDAFCINEAQKLIELDSELIYPYEVLCKLYINAIARNKRQLIKDVQLIVEKLLTLAPINHVAKIAQIVIKLCSNSKEDLMVLLSQIESGKSVEDCIVLMRSSELIHQYDKSVEFATDGLKYCKISQLNETDYLVKELQLGLINAELNLNINIEKNVSILENLLTVCKSGIEICKLLVLSHLKLGDIEIANKLCSNSSVWEANTDLMNGYLGAILRRQNEIKSALEKLEIAVKKFPNDSFLMMELALAFRHSNDYSNSLLYLLTALKEDSYNPNLFFEIGNHYLFQKDLVKCQRCYKKSFTINPNNKDVAIALSDLYAQMDLDKENLDLLTTITSNDKNKWALIRLGYCHYKQQNLTLAIKSLQKALSLDNKDGHCWEYLADCYMKRGSYTAALKSYTRALELNPDSIYCYYQMAEIRQLLQDYDNAVKEYQIILSKEPTYIPALKGYGMVKLLQANYYFQECLPGLAKDSCAKAIEIFSNAILLQPNLSCLWKLLGDSCTIIHKIPIESCRFDFPEEFVKKTGISNKTLKKQELLYLGARCYKQALSLQETDDLWHDIATNYHYQAYYTTEKTEKKILYNQSLLAIKKAVTINSQNFSHWNALGVIAFRLKNFGLAQHAFINSIKVEDNNPDAWTYLGFIYLFNDNIELAHKSFSVAQTLDPESIKCWIGMAMIAEKIGHLEAMDLFRHTTSLGYQAESALGYAHWVAHVLLDDEIDKDVKMKFWFENMASLPTPSDCLVKYTGHITNDAQAYNTLGIFLEREKLYSEACKAFENAIRLCGHSEDKTQLDFARSNYARVLCHRGQYAKSSEEFLAVKNPDFYSQCGLALTFYKGERYEESIQAYEAAMHWFAKTDNEKSNVFVAMAAVAYRMKNIEVAKQLLFQSFELQPPSIYGVFSLCAIGLLLNDSNLVAAATKEMLPHLKNHIYLNSVIKLLSFTMILQGENKSAQRIISKSIHEFPTQDKLWFTLSEALLQLPNVKSEVIDRCLSILLAKRNSHTSDIPINQVFKFRNIVHLANGYVSECVKSAQKLLILNPNDTANWAGLLASTVMRDGCYRTTVNQKWFIKLLNFTTKQSNSTENTKLTQWLRWYQSLMSLYSDSIEAPRNSNLESSTDQILHWIKQNKKKPNIDELKQYVAADPEFSFGWQVLVNSLIALGKQSEAVDILKSFKDISPVSLNVTSAILYNLALDEYQKSKRKDWLQIAEKMESQMKNSVETKIACFLLAKKHFIKNEQKKMKVKLEQLQSSSICNGYKWIDAATKSILSEK